MSRSWKRSDGMSYRDWGRVRKERALVEDWKQQIQEEQEVSETSSVFVIINSWLPVGSPVEGTEIVGGKWFPTEDDAWEALGLIAESRHSELYAEDTSFEPAFIGNHLDWEEYRIEELTRA